MIPPFEPCPAFEEVLDPHVLKCIQCQKALKNLQSIEWKIPLDPFCADGLQIINMHLTACNRCATGTSAYLQQLAEAFLELEDKPKQ